MMKKVFRFFGDNLIAGIVALLPITITVLVIRFLVIKVNSIMFNPLLRRLSPYLLQEQQRLLLAKAAIFLCVILIIVVIGLMTRVIVVRRIFSFLERLLYKLPMINKIYGSTKEISNAFLGNKKSSFKDVVLIEYPRKGVYALGFITSESTGQLQEAVGGGDLANVYIPTSPNPTSGLFVLLKKQDITPLDMSVEEALKVVISAGAITPSYKKDKG